MNVWRHRIVSGEDRRLASPTQSGFSIVEIMVSLVVGLIVVAGVSQIYLGSKQSYRLNEARSRLQEDGRFALEYLARNIRLAGHKSQPWTEASVSFKRITPTDASSPSFAEGQVVTGLYGGAASTDTTKVSIRFEGRADGSVHDCLGGDVGADVRAANTFAVDTTDHELECTATNPAPGGTAPPQPFISGFGNFEVLYGIDTDGDPHSSRSANQYVSAANMGANWLNVTSVRIRFELRSAEDNLTLAPARTYLFNGVNYTDRRLIEPFETTISLRNTLP